MGIAISETKVTLHINLIELYTCVNLNIMLKTSLYLEIGYQMPQ